MTQRYAVLMGAFAILAQGAIFIGCSSAGDDDGAAGSGTTAGAPSAGSGNTAGAPSAGTGQGGTTSAGGASAQGGRNMDLECRGISRDAACTLMGKECPNLVCGLADTGRRECNCTGTWGCTACDYSASPWPTRPTDITTCSGVEADGITCATQGAVCEGAAGGEVCACWPDDEGVVIWDCDSPPSVW